MLLKFGILGAGSIGAYVGAHLIRAGIDTVLVGRDTLGREIRENGLRVTDFTGKDFRLAPEQVRYATETGALADRDIILVTLKSLATEDAARELKAALPAGKTVVSFQNGVRNADLLRSILTDARVLAGMVPYNVVWNKGAHFHGGTSGALVVQASGETSRAVVEGLNKAGLDAVEHADLPGILWGKLVFNLNNAVNALAGVPLREELSQPAYRKIMAAAIREALTVFKQCGIKPVRSGRMIPGLAAPILSLPNFLFFKVASGMIKIDPQARSSMWEDLQKGRKTEIDFLNGEIVRLAESNGLRAPVNSAITALIREAEAAKNGSPRLSAAELSERLRKQG